MSEKIWSTRLNNGCVVHGVIHGPGFAMGFEDLDGKLSIFVDQARIVEAIAEYDAYDGNASEAGRLLAVAICHAIGVRHESEGPAR